MNRHVNAIAGRLSLRPPQRHSLEILDRSTEIVPPRKGIDVNGALAAIRSEFPTVTDFEREFPSLCFALAPGVGKTRLMGAFISYLHLAHDINNFFVLAPNLTIYNKLIADFTPGMPKYVFKGIAEFATELPDVITGDTYESAIDVHRDVLPGIQSRVRINIFNMPELQAEVTREVKAQYRSPQLELEGITQLPDIAAVVTKTTELVIQQTIDIPRILVLPKGEVRSGFKSFTLDLDTLRYQAPDEDLWIQYLRTGGTEVVGLGRGGIEEARLEDHVVSGLVDFDDVAYDNHADLLYDLATQTVQHFRTYLSEDDTRKVLRLHQREIVRFIHAQMQQHYWEEAVGYEVVVSKGFTDLKPSAYASSATTPPFDFRQSPADKSNMAKYLFTGFQRCLYPVQKFQSEAERILAIILDREANRWFKPAKGQFQIFYKSGADHLEYQPDFVAETADTIYMLEPKAKNQMEDTDVLAKQEAALQWCLQASAHAETCGGKPWKYALIPHDLIAVNMTIAGLVEITTRNR